MTDSMKPAIVAAARDEATARAVEVQLLQRYSFDYRVRSVVDDAAEAERGSEDAALVMVDALWGDASAVLSRIREKQPSTRRLAIAPWGMPVASKRLQALLHAGLAEYFVIVPQVPPDEQFHRTISEFLEEWSRTNSATFEVVRMIDGGSAKGHRLRDLMQRNNVTHGSHSPFSTLGREILDEHGLGADQLPVLVLFDGRVLVDPSERELADAITGQSADAPSDVDLVIVGAGPAGLAAAVYAASEGLDVVVLEREAIGGQAGTTSLIRNYLGFNRGITGQELASRAFRQAWSFGANVRFMREATALRRVPDWFVVSVSDGTEIRGRAVILAQGVTYRRVGVPALEELVGAGVYYGAAVTEAPTTRGKEVFVVGGGNSAGQAAVHLSSFAARVTVLVRGDSLAESMSDYLVNEMRVIPNISIEFGRQIVDGGGSSRLEWLEIEDRTSGSTRHVDAVAVFILIGAVSATDWLPDEIATDRWGFVLTGRESEESPLWTLDRVPYSFETSVPGVFAVGDVRQGSVKRVASAAGEGSVAIQSCHAFLSQHPDAAAAAGVSGQ
jgi:thioredoxin reductase (NADPH)